jgi:thiamine monophosphate synthase
VTGQLVLALTLTAFGLGWAILQPIRHHTDAPPRTCPAAPAAEAMKRTAEAHQIRAAQALTERLTQQAREFVEARQELQIRLWSEQTARLVRRAQALGVGQ